MSIPKILIIDDKPQNLFALEKLLNQLEVKIIQTTSGPEALGLTLEHDFCLAIVDVQMPEMDGYELVELLRGNPGTASLPVMFVSAIYSDEYHHRKGYDAGAVDFLSKPFAPEILLSKVRVFLELHRQRVKLQELVADLNDKNQALKKLNADKDKFFSIISHDLRGPFTTLIGNTELMLTSAANLTQQDIQEMNQSIYNAVKAAHSLLENLLTWSQMQLGRMKYEPGPFELRQSVKNTVMLLQDIALDKHIRLEQVIEPGLFVNADRNMLETVIRNLTSNALKFTPPKGQVTLSAVPHNGTMVWVEVTVSDTGVGISREDLDKLFKIEAYHTTEGTAQEKGTGLGLILCQEMVEKNGGKLWVESELGKGTEVKFTVPAVKVLNLTAKNE